MTELKISNTEEEWTIVNHIPLIATSDRQKSPSLQSLMIGTTMVS
jgi:hypothetical protein